MEKWRVISAVGIVLGIVMSIMDYFIKSIPYAIIIPLDIIAVILIFTGLIMRKKARGK
ncbi:MAG: hypothetical protein IKY23_07590 [Lachnospiraceae bacterium]|nr:hypothetical protein [Lachnospiraceae bacterium]